MTSTVLPDELATFVAELDELVERHDDERRLTAEIAARLTAHLAAGFELPAGTGSPGSDHYVMYPLYIDPRGRFSIAAAVWGVGQGTPVHGHETWGVVGIHSGVEHEVGYSKPATDGEIPQVTSENDWTAGDVTVCCTTDDDIHQVSCGSDVPCVGIHVYGADIGTLPRRAYEPTTGATRWFTTTWSSPGVGA